MATVNESASQFGELEIVIDYINGKQEKRYIQNTILRTAKQAQASSITNQIGTEFEFFVDRMLFGTNGTVGNAPRFVEDTRNGLFGPVLLIKPVISTVNQDALNQAIFTAVVTFDEGNGSIINEMALQMRNDNLYSMICFGGLSKSSAQQITINWRISFV